MRAVLTISLLVGLLTPSGLFAQPVITENDFLNIGDTAVREFYVSPLSVAAFTGPGPTGTWDFTSIPGMPIFVESLECLPPSAGVVDPAVDFPLADRCVKFTPVGAVPGPYGPPPFWEYFSYNSSGRTAYGLVFEGPPAPMVFAQSVPTVDFPLPVTLGQQWTENFEVGFPLINQLQLASTVDAWGTATLPGIGAVNCLRVTSEVTNSLLDASGPGAPIPLFTEYSRRYTWLAQGVDVVVRLSSEPSMTAVPGPGFSAGFELGILVDHVPVSNSGEFVRGDVDSSGSVNIVDAVDILLYLFVSGTLSCLSAADLDDDGNIETGDAVSALNFLFNSGPAPAAPYLACGPDPTVDLGCTSSGCP